MTVNFVIPHKHGDRKALGIYRIVAASLMFLLFIFLTVYESVIQKNRVVLTMVWWVSLGTFLYFTLSLVPIRAYFDEKLPVISDGHHPFYDWKLVTGLNCFCLQAAIHLIVLQHLKDYDFEVVDLACIVTAYTSFTFLLCDWFANRLYFPAGISLAYCFFAYAIGLLSLLIQHEVEQVYPMPELEFFSLQEDQSQAALVWFLPLIAMLVVSASTRVKHWYLSEGDRLSLFLNSAPQLKGFHQLSKDSMGQDQEDSIDMNQRLYDNSFFVQPVTASGKETEELLLDEDKHKELAANQNDQESPGDELLQNHDDGILDQEGQTKTQKKTNSTCAQLAYQGASEVFVEPDSFTRLSITEKATTSDQKSQSFAQSEVIMKPSTHSSPPQACKKSTKLHHRQQQQPPEKKLTKRQRYLLEQLKDSNFIKQKIGK